MHIHEGGPLFYSQILARICTSTVTGLYFGLFAVSLRSGSGFNAISTEL